MNEQSVFSVLFTILNVLFRAVLNNEGPVMFGHEQKERYCNLDHILGYVANTFSVLLFLIELYAKVWAPVVKYLQMTYFKYK